MNLTREKETASNGSKEKNLQSHLTEEDLAFTDSRAHNFHWGVSLLLLSLQNPWFCHVTSPRMCSLCISLV